MVGNRLLSRGLLMRSVFRYRTNVVLTVLCALAVVPATALFAAGEGANVIVIEDCEDAAKAAGDRWKLAGYYRPHSPRVEYVFDKDRGSRVVEFKGKPKPFVRDPLSKKSFARFIEQKYPIDVDALTARLLKHGIMKPDGDNFRFPPGIMAIPDRYQFLDVLRKLPDKFTEDELTVAVAVWARRHMIRQPRWRLKVDKAIGKDEIVELQWAMRFDPKSWTSRSFVVILMIKGTRGSKKFKYYMKETHVIDLETQGEEPGYVKAGWAKRDQVFYWRLMDEWKKEPGPVKRGRYSRCFLDAQVTKQTPVKGWYVFRCNLTDDIGNSRRPGRLDRNGKVRIVSDTLERINSIDIDAADCRMDDIKLIITKKKE